MEYSWHLPTTKMTIFSIQSGSSPAWREFEQNEGFHGVQSGTWNKKEEQTV
jgi:hypothetical protein